MKTNETKYPGDDRIKAFCLKRGLAIPTDNDLEEFPMEFRLYEGLPSVEFGCSLLRWMVTKRSKPTNQKH